MKNYLSNIISALKFFGFVALCGVAFVGTALFMGPFITPTSPWYFAPIGFVVATLAVAGIITVLDL